MKQYEKTKTLEQRINTNRSTKLNQDHKQIQVDTGKVKYLTSTTQQVPEEDIIVINEKEKG